MELLTATGKLKTFFLSIRYSGSRHTHVNMGASIFFTAAMIRAFRHGSCWCTCGKNLNITSMCAMSPMVHTSNISSCQKNFFSFPVAFTSHHCHVMGALIFFTAAMIHAFRSARSCGNGGTYLCTPPLPRDLSYLKARIIAAVKNIDVPMLMCVWQELRYRIAVYHVTHGAHIEHL
jgi:hypothetical protein